MNSQTPSQKEPCLLKIYSKVPSLKSIKISKNGWGKCPTRETSSLYKLKPNKKFSVEGRLFNKFYRQYKQRQDKGQRYENALIFSSNVTKVQGSTSSSYRRPSHRKSKKPTDRAKTPTLKQLGSTLVIRQVKNNITSFSRCQCIYGSSRTRSVSKVCKKCRSSEYEYGDADKTNPDSQRQSISEYGEDDNSYLNEPKIYQ